MDVESGAIDSQDTQDTGEGLKVETQSIVEKEAEPANSAEVKPAKKKVSAVYTGEELLQLPITEMPMLLEPLLPKSGLAVLAGSSDTGKSAFLRQLATTIVLDQPEAFGFKLNTVHKSAIYVSSEDDDLAISYLLNKQNVQKLSADQFKNLRYIFESDHTAKCLDKELIKQPADLVVLDTLTDFFGGTDFNNVAAVRGFFKQYKELSQKHGCLIIFNHHLGKAKEQSVPSKNSLLGSMGVESKARVVLELRKDRFDPKLRQLIPLKGNYMSEELKNQSFVLMFDENMVFTNTGETVAIEELAGQRSMNDTPEIKDRVYELHQKKKSCREIAKQIETDFGIKIGKSTVANWCKNIKPDIERKKLTTKPSEEQKTETQSEP